MGLSKQLASGVRFLDVRLAAKDGKLCAYHPTAPHVQRLSFQKILGMMQTFLRAPASALETLVVSIMQGQTRNAVPEAVFAGMVRAEIARGPGGRGMWFLENRVPTLGEVRGRVVLLSRFGDEGMRITPWPRNRKEGFVGWCGETAVRVHDW
jgi:1-phosphatidylinositol phosphodiesterase